VLASNRIPHILDRLACRQVHALVQRLDAEFGVRERLGVDVVVVEKEVVSRVGGMPYLRTAVV